MDGWKKVKCYMMADIISWQIQIYKHTRTHKSEIVRWLVYIIRWLNVTLFSFFLLMHLIMSITFVCLENFKGRLFNINTHWLHKNVYYKNKLYEEKRLHKEIRITLVSTLSLVHKIHSFPRDWSVHETKYTYLHAANTIFVSKSTFIYVSFI